MAKTSRISILVFVGVLLAGFSPWWLGGRVFAPLDTLNELYEPWATDRDVNVHNHFTTDAVTQYLIYRKFADSSYYLDGFVGWNPYIAGGSPAYANTMALYDDWTMQLHRVFEFWTAWHLGYIGHFLLAGIGMLLFLRSRGLSPPIALAGAFAYAANANFIIWFYHRWQLSAFAWAPLIVWSLYRYREGATWAWPLVPILLALSFLGGNLQTSAFVGILYFGIWISWLFDRQSRESSRRKLTAHFGVWGILGIGLAGFALYPNVLAYFDNLSIGHVRGTIGYEEQNPLFSTLFIALQAFPTILGSPRSVDLSRLLHLNLFDITYFGVVPTVLAYCALFMRQAPLVLRTLILLGLLIPLTPLTGVLYHRVQIVFVFGGVWAFAWLFQHADRVRFERLLKCLFVAFVSLVALWIAVSSVLVIFEERLLRAAQNAVAARIDEGTFGVFREWMLQRPRILIHELRIWHPRQLIPVAATLVCLGAFWLRVRRGIESAAWLLSAALVVELGAFAAGWITVVDTRQYPPYEETRDISELRKLAADGRVYVLDDPERPRLLWPNTLSALGIGDIDAFESIRSPNMWQVAGFPTDAHHLGQFGVTHQVTYPDEQPVGTGWQLAYQGDRFNIWSNTRALPFYLAVAASETGWADRFRADPGEALDNVIAAGPVIVRDQTPNHRVLEVPADSVALRIAENWSEGWEYRIGGGSWHAVERSPDLSMLIPLEVAGAPETLSLRYRPERRVHGWWISLGSLMALAFGTWIVNRSRSTRAAQAGLIDQPSMRSSESPPIEGKPS